jgi:hypothetical protein
VAAKNTSSTTDPYYASGSGIQFGGRPMAIRRYDAMMARLSAIPAFQRLTQERLLAGLRKAAVPG